MLSQEVGSCRIQINGENAGTARHRCMMYLLH